MTLARTLAHRAITLPRVTIGTLLERLIKADQAYRDHKHLHDMPQIHLRDVGLHRDANGDIARR